MDLVADPQIANATALTATTIEALWPAATYSRIEANSVTSAPKVFVVKAGGIMSTAASGTLTITPSIGTATGGATLGASVAQTVVVSLTNVPWYLEFIAVVRTVGSAGTMMGTGVFQSAGAAATAGSGIQVSFGGTSATFDTTAAPASTTGAITIAKTLSVAGSVTPMYAFMQTVN
jgi:hypothetical protein